MKVAASIAILIISTSLLFAEYTAGELVDGLNECVAKYDSNGVALSKNGDKAFNFIAGYWSAMRAAAEFESYEKTALNGGEITYKYEDTPDTLLEYMRSVLSYYQTVPYLRDEPARDFLLINWMASCAATDEQRQKSIRVLKQTIIRAAFRAARNPDESTALTRWLDDKEPTNKLDSYTYKYAKIAFTKAKEN